MLVLRYSGSQANFEIECIATRENENENRNCCILMRFDFIYRYKVRRTSGRENARQEAWKDDAGVDILGEKFVMKSASPGS